jgi:hypothetical protein
MALPGIEAERWRLVEQKLAEFSVDIQRLWRQIQQTQVGGYAQSGALTPDELAALTAAGSGGGGDTVRVYTLAIRGNASAGTISWSAVDGGSPTTGTFSFDDDDADVITALTSFDSGVQAEGGTLKYNAIKIKFTDSTQRLRITSSSLTRDTNGVTPVPELSYCDEPASWWE